MLAGDTLAVLPHHLEQMRRDERAIDELAVADQRKALDRLIGRTAAAINIDPRLRKAMKQLVARRATLKPDPSRAQRRPASAVRLGDT